MSEAVLLNLRRVGAERIATRLAKEYHMPLERILGRDNRPAAVRVRHHLWTLVHDTLVLSYPETGAIFDRDHTTIMAGLRRHAERRRT